MMSSPTSANKDQSLAMTLELTRMLMCWLSGTWNAAKKSQSCELLDSTYVGFNVSNNSQWRLLRVFQVQSNKILRS